MRETNGGIEVTETELEEAVRNCIDDFQAATKHLSIPQWIDALKELISEARMRINAAEQDIERPEDAE